MGTVIWEIHCGSMSMRALFDAELIVYIAKLASQRVSSFPKERLDSTSRSIQMSVDIEKEEVMLAHAPAGPMKWFSLRKRKVILNWFHLVNHEEMSEVVRELHSTK